MGSAHTVQQCPPKIYVNARCSLHRLESTGEPSVHHHVSQSFIAWQRRHQVPENGPTPQNIISPGKVKQQQPPQQQQQHQQQHQYKAYLRQISPVQTTPLFLHGGQGQERGRHAQGGSGQVVPETENLPLKDDKAETEATTEAEAATPSTDCLENMKPFLIGGAVVAVGAILLGVLLLARRN
ncbi:unnamed protein product [Boreogadus saida]